MIQHLLDHQKSESSRKTSISALLTMPKPLTMWFTINCGNFFKRWETMASPSKELPGRESIEIAPSEGPSHRTEGSPSEKEPGGAKLPPKTHRKMARE